MTALVGIRSHWGRGGRAAALLVAAIWLAASPARAADPIKIGMSMALTGGLASGGKVMLITLKMGRRT